MKCCDYHFSPKVGNLPGEDIPVVLMGKIWDSVFWDLL